MKKMLAVVCVLALLLSSFAFAEEDRLGGLTLPLVDEEVTLTWLYTSQFEHNQDEWIFQKYKEYTGIQFVPLAFTSDVFSQKLATYLASADLPDLISGGLSSQELAMYGAQGAFACVNDYLDITPNLKALFFDNADNYERLSAYFDESGNLYSYPMYGLNRDVNYGFMYRADVFEELGIEPWTSTETFLDALRTLKEAYPDSYPYGSKNGTAIFSRWASYFDVNAIPLAYDYEAGAWYVGAASDGFREMLDTLKLMYNEKLLDPEFLTDSLDAWNAKQLNNQNFVMNDWIGRMALLEPDGQKANENFDLKFGAPIGNMKSQELEKFSNWGFEVANNENVVAAVKFCDFMYSDFGSELSTIGIEGENFYWDENGVAVYPDIEGVVGIEKMEQTFGMWTNCFYLKPDHRSCYYTFTEDEQYAQDLINDVYGYSKVAPPQVVADADQESFTQLQSELGTKMNTFASNYIMTESYGDAEWNAWVESAMKDYGDALLAMLNK